MKKIVLVIVTLLIFTSNSFARNNYCEVSWDFPPLRSTKQYSGFGNSKNAAIENARKNCRSENILDNWKKYCGNNPISTNCGNPDNSCISSIKIISTGYPNSGGNKTKWCLSQGFDGYNPSMESKSCIRKCPDYLCTKIPIKKLGYRQGNKTNFCLTRGFDGQSDVFGEDGGYCFNGLHANCALPVPPAPSEPKPEPIRRIPGIDFPT